MNSNFKKYALLGLATLAALSPAVASSSNAKEAPNFGANFQSSKINNTVQELESLLVLMQERLSVMQEVAKYKWNHNKTEECLKAELMTCDENDQTQKEFISNFLAAQNDAAQKVQEELFDQSRVENLDKFDSVKDYEKELVPQLNSINQKMIESASQLLVLIQDESLPSFIKDLSYGPFKNEGITLDIYESAITPLFEGE